MIRRPTIPRCATAALAVLLTGCSAVRSPIPQPTPENPLRGLDAYAERAVDEWGIAGLAIAVIEGDSVVFAEGYGVRDVRTREPVDPHTIFAIGSNSKLFTAVAAGILVDEEKIDWDDPATEHLPGFQLFDPYVTREISVRDLLSHRSGLGRRGDLLWYGSDRDRDEILQRIRHLEPNTSFRSQFGYQNVMFLAAGEAVANAAGTTWDDFIDRRIFAPLGMERSTTSTVPLDETENVATPHIYDDGELISVPYRNIDNIAPAGSINSSVTEMAEWIEMLLNDGTYDGRELIDTATLAEIMTPQTIIPREADTLFASTHFVAYGLGVVLQDYGGAKLAWHTGGIDGMLSLVSLLPEQDVGVVILTNTAGHNNLFTALMYRIFDAYLGLPPRDWSEIFLRRLEEQEAEAAQRRRQAEVQRAENTSPSLTLDAYAGTYRDPLYGDIEIGLEGDSLALRFGPAFVADLEHWHYNTFRANWQDPTQDPGFVTFTLDPFGKVAGVNVEDLADFERVPDDVETAVR